MTEPIHCSALPRIMSCPASSQQPTVRIDQTSPEAQVGTRVHAMIAHYLRQEASVDTWPEWPDLGELEPDVRFLWFRFMDVWREYGAGFEPVYIEQEFGGKLCGRNVQGTPDFVGINRETNVVAIFDWKTGYNERPAIDQLIGYSQIVPYAEFENLDPLPEMPLHLFLITGWLRLGIVDVKERPDPAEWRKRLAEALGSDAYNPTPENCQYCPLNHECDAHASQMRGCANALAERPFAELSTADFLGISLLLPSLEKRIGEYKDIRKQLLQRVGPQSLGDGRVIKLKPYQVKTVNLIKGWQLLSEALGIEGDMPELIETLGAAVNLKKDVVLSLVANRAGKGQMGKAKKELMEALEGIEALEIAKHEKISIEREE